MATRTVQVTIKIDEPGPPPACLRGDLLDPDVRLRVIAAGVLADALAAQYPDLKGDGQFCWATNYVTGDRKFISIEGVNVLSEKDERPEWQRLGFSSADSMDKFEERRSKQRL